MEPVEVEVKFFLPVVEPVRRAILDMGAESHGRVFETNLRFEDSVNSLKRRQSLLRLRKDSAARLTFKSNIPGTDSQFKMRRELEVVVDDFSTMKHILDSLGYHQEQVYEKWRETFSFGKVEFCIDNMPYGDFLEIEGDKESIRAVADRLGLDWDRRILRSYIAIFEVIRQGEHFTFTDITFNNFNMIDSNLNAYLHILEAGGTP